LLPARLSRYKGHAVFIELIASLAGEHPDLHGVILGPGRPGSRYRAELEGLAQREGVMDRITLTGLRTDIRDWMAISSIVFNLCSDPPEAFGRTIPEALRLGIPVIAWNHGGVKEILAGMFPAGAVRPDSFDDLLTKTRAFLKHKQVVSENHSFLLSDSMQQTLALYESTTGKTP
jgi:glycosyltransferase involved in cell wall biosynthesis